MSYLFSYKDVTVHSYDLALFANKNWLNDICISLAFRLLDDCFCSSSIEMADSLPVMLVDPSVVSFIRIQAEDDEDFDGVARGTNVRKYTWLLLPVNDSISFESASTHWSILICHVPTFTLFHADSCGSSNLESVHHLIPQLQRLLDIRRNDNNNTSNTVIALNVPRQENSYDCGIYTILFAKNFLELLRGDLAANNFDLAQEVREKLQIVCSANITSKTASTYRQFLRDEIKKKFHV